MKFDNTDIALDPLPLCACGAPAVFFKPGVAPLISEATDIPVRAGVAATGTCLSCNAMREPIMARKPKNGAADADKPESNVNPDDIAKCLAEYEEFMGERARVDQKISAMFGRYEKMGVSKKGIKAAYRRRDMTQAEIRAEMAEELHYMRVLELVEWDDKGQGSLAAVFGGEVKKPSTEAQALRDAAAAFNAGYKSGRGGHEITACPHANGSEQFIRWRDGWVDGEADRVAHGPAPKPGRPKKTPETAPVSEAAAAEPMPEEPPPAVH